MRRILHLVIFAGDKTCASEPGKFCKHVMAKKFGSIPFCQVYNKELSSIDRSSKFYEVIGWLQRLPECLRDERAGRFTPGRLPEKCAKCRGTGKIQKWYADGRGFYSRKCPACGGKGK